MAAVSGEEFPALFIPSQVNGSRSPRVNGCRFPRPVGIEYKDVLFVGEIIRCTPGSGEQWEIDIKVAQTLTGLQSLMILRAQLEQFQTPIMPEFALLAKKSPIAIDQCAKLRKQPHEPKH